MAIFLFHPEKDPGRVWGISPRFLIGLITTLTLSLTLTLAHTLILTHTLNREYYSAIKRNEMEVFVMRWMELESVIQSEVSQREKNKYSMLTHIYGI